MSSVAERARAVGGCTPAKLHRLTVHPGEPIACPCARYLFPWTLAPGTTGTVTITPRCPQCRCVVEATLCCGHPPQP